MTQPLSASLVASKVIHAITVGESATFSRDGSALPTTGYFVGGKAPTAVIDPQYRVSLEAIASWVDSYRSDYVGVWLEHDTGLFHVDMSDWIVNRSYALGLAKRRGEKAIYDVWNAEDIKVEA